MKKILYLFTVLFLISCSAKVILKQDYDFSKKMRVAVLPFKSHPTNPNSGNIAYESFLTYLLEIKNYTIIDRGLTEEIIKEQKLNMSGTIDPKKAIEIGKLLGAQAVITGSITEYVNKKALMFPPAKVTITARMISTETGEVLWAATKTAGGPKRWFSWLIWPLGLYETVTSPDADELIQKATKVIVKSLNKKISRK